MVAGLLGPHTIDIYAKSRFAFVDVGGSSPVLSLSSREARMFLRRVQDTKLPPSDIIFISTSRGLEKQPKPAFSRPAGPSSLHRRLRDLQSDEPGHAPYPSFPNIPSGSNGKVDWPSLFPPRPIVVNDFRLFPESQDLGEPNLQRPGAAQVPAPDDPNLPVPKK
jgi:hypothetical protein